MTSLLQVGVEPDGASVEAAKKSILELAAQQKQTVEVTSFVRMAEDITVEEWKKIAALPGRKIVHSAFTLHHLSARDRQQLLANLNEVRCCN